MNAQTTMTFDLTATNAAELATLPFGTLRTIGAEHGVTIRVGTKKTVAVELLLARQDELLAAAKPAPEPTLAELVEAGAIDEPTPESERPATIAQLVARFPETFGLACDRDSTFRISERSSYINDAGIPMLYTQRLNKKGAWEDFAKGTLEELGAQITPAPDTKPEPEHGVPGLPSTADPIGLKTVEELLAKIAPAGDELETSNDEAPAWKPSRGVARDERRHDPRLPEPGSKLETTYKGQRYEATMLANGEVEFNGQTYSSVSRAAAKVVGGAVNGFEFWRLNKKAGITPRPRTATSERIPREAKTAATMARFVERASAAVKAIPLAQRIELLDAWLDLAKAERDLAEATDAK